MLNLHLPFEYSQGGYGKICFILNIFQPMHDMDIDIDIKDVAYRGWRYKDVVPHKWPPTWGHRMNEGRIARAR